MASLHVFSLKFFKNFQNCYLGIIDVSKHLFAKKIPFLVSSTEFLSEKMSLSSMQFHLFTKTPEQRQ